MFLFHRPTTNHLTELLGVAAHQALTYSAVGATRSDPPVGYHHDWYSLDLGPPSCFPRAAQGLRDWKAHEGVGASIFPDDEVSEGATHIVVLRLGPAWMLAPVRIVYVIDEQDRYGWAYGTLPGHPEEGEELFLVRRDADATVFEIAAFSRHAEPLARLMSPITRVIQKKVTRQYLEGLKLYASEDPGVLDPFGGPDEPDPDLNPDPTGDFSGDEDDDPQGR